MPDPPVISVNTGPGDGNLGGAQIIEPADPTAGPGQGSCGAEGGPTCRIAFNIRLNNTWKRTVKVNYAVADVTATAADYTNPAPSTLTATFTPGETLKTVYAPVTADVLDEPDETIKVTLSAPVNGTLDPSTSRSSAIGTILDNDGPPVITATSPADFLEFNGEVACRLKLDAVSGKDITVNWTSADGAAISPGDYSAQTSRSVVIPKGTLSTDITVPVLDDAIDEDAENFFFNITGATNVTVPAFLARTTIPELRPMSFSRPVAMIGTVTLISGTA